MVACGVADFAVVFGCSGALFEYLCRITLLCGLVVASMGSCLVWVWLLVGLFWRCCGCLFWISNWVSALVAFGLLGFVGGC